MLPTPDDVAAAADRLRPHVVRTPVVTSSSLDAACGSRVLLKAENLQRTGSFKIRGATHALLGLAQEERRRGVIAFSSGNHAQGVARAARALGIPAVIVMPEDASPLKRAAAEADGARIVPCPADRREEVARELATREGLTLVPPFEDPRVIAGQGTAAWELFQQEGPLDLLLVPVGGGGLIGGSALAAAARCPSCRVVGIEPERAADAGASFRAGAITALPAVPDTIADGLRTRRVGEPNFALIRSHVADMAAVREEAIAAAVRFLLLRLKLLVEPSGAVGVAALLSGAVRAPGARVGVIVSGGNVDPGVLVRCLEAA